MIPHVLVCLGVMGACFGEEPAPPGTNRSADMLDYQKARKDAGRDAKAHIRLALWCEAHGLGSERIKHLAMAVLYDPSNALARGLMGLVAYQGKWERPDQISRQVQEDPKLIATMQEYLHRRVKTSQKADDQWKLAVWCEQNGLKDQAIAHYHAVLRRDPGRESAWKRLGFKKVGGRWVKPEWLAVQKQESEQQSRANKRWKPLLERYRSALQSKAPSNRIKAEQALSQIADRNAVPMVWAIFAEGSVALQKVAVQVLGQIDDPSASRALTLLAVFSESAEVRSQATAILRRRDAREFASLLIGMIQQPIEYKVQPVGGPGQGGRLLIKGQGSGPNVMRVYTPPPIPLYLQTTAPASNFSMGELQAMVATNQQQLVKVEGHALALLAQSGLGPRAENQIIQSYENQANGGVDPSTLLAMARSAPTMTPTVRANPGSRYLFNFAPSGMYVSWQQMAFASQQSAIATEQQLETDVATIQQINASVRQVDDRVVPVLKEVSGLDFGTDQDSWQKWLINLLGYQQLSGSTSPSPDPETPTIVEQVPIAYLPQPLPIETNMIPVSCVRVSCFGAGTLVRTLTGLEPIETLKVGDPVLTQSTKTGALAYKPILAVHHNPPSKTFDVTLGGETVVSSEFHRFWKAGQGWVMARDLKEGDRIRTLDGPMAVTRIERGEVVLVYNLDVAEDADFFVSGRGILVHDNTLPDLRERPFDAVETLGGPVKNSKSAP